MYKELSKVEQKERDYDSIIRNIEGIVNLEHLEPIENMIKLFDHKWKPKESLCDLT